MWYGCMAIGVQTRDVREQPWTRTSPENESKKY
jgi:hypothetical protein